MLLGTVTLRLEEGRPELAEAISVVTVVDVKLAVELDNAESTGKEAVVVLKTVDRGARDDVRLVDAVEVLFSPFWRRASDAVAA